ncbi:MAG TPA: RimK/LysX family protein [Herpetosiphonaceae bacterium]|nr:RimK/LysX family protein [Herpetosiphonaceae bacterium]
MSQFLKGQRLLLWSFVAALAFLAGLAVDGISVPFSGRGEAEPSSDRVVLGRTEVVELSNPANGKSVKVSAKLDSGADSSSIDTVLAKELGFDLAKADRVTIKSALGRKKRPVIDLRLQIGGRTIETRATVNDRSELEYQMLVGARDLNGFLLDTATAKLTSKD